MRVVKSPQSPHSNVYRSSWWPNSRVHGSILFKIMSSLQLGQAGAIGANSDGNTPAHVISFRSTCFKARSRDAKKGPDDQATVTGDCEMSRSRLELANGIGKTCSLIAAYSRKSTDAK